MRAPRSTDTLTVHPVSARRDGSEDSYDLLSSGYVSATEVQVEHVSKETTEEAGDDEADSDWE